MLVDRLDQILVLGDRFEAVGLRRRFRTPRTPGRRHQRQIRIGVDLGEIEFEFRRHDRSQAQFLVELHHAPQHVTRRDVVGLAVGVISIGEDERGRRLVTGRDANRIDVGPEHDIWILRRHRLIGLVGILAGDSQQIDARRNPQRAIALALQKFLRRKHLAANNPVQIRDQTLDFADAALFDPIRKTHDTHMHCAHAKPRCAETARENRN